MDEILTFTVDKAQNGTKIMRVADYDYELSEKECDLILAMEQLHGTSESYPKLPPCLDADVGDKVTVIDLAKAYSEAMQPVFDITTEICEEMHAQLAQLVEELSEAVRPVIDDFEQEEDEEYRLGRFGTEMKTTQKDPSDYHLSHGDLFDGIGERDLNDD